jgi:Fe-S cluster biogenesis protein NfuA
MNDQEIRITAQPLLNPDVCIFTLDRAVLPSGSFNCKDAEMAKGSALLEALFATGIVREVSVTGAILTIAKSSPEPWNALGKQIGEVIREAIKSGKPLLAADLKKPTLSDEQIHTAVQELFENEINPALSGHGGFVQLIEVKNASVYLKLAGGCQGCGAASITLKHGIERAILDRVPEVAEVVDVTDHTAGANPYY